MMNSLPAQYPYTISGTRQELFDKVVEHLATQKYAAVGTYFDPEEDQYIPSCMYRTGSGASCAVGSLLPDAIAKDLPMGSPYLPLVSLGYFVRDYNTHLIAQLQSAHDSSYDLLSLKDNLRNIASEYQLSGAKIDTITEWQNALYSDSHDDDDDRL